MNRNVNQAIEDEEAGMQEREEDIDYDALYGGEEIDTTPPPKTEEIKKDYIKLFGEMGRDMVKQGTKELLIGAGGTYGDLAELVGIKGEPGPGLKTRLNKQSEILNEMEHPEYKSSFSDIDALMSEDDLAPAGFKVPSSNDLRSLNDAVGGPGEAETAPGRYASRAGKLYGAGASFGQVNPVPSLAAAVTGQTVEELGGGSLLQAGTEIATLLLTQGRSGKSLSGTAKQEVQEKIANLRNLGYTEEEITLAINSASKGKKLGVRASKGSKTEQAFQDFAEHSDEMVADLLSAEIPGYEKGIKNVHEMASDAYGQVVQDGAKLTIKNSKPFTTSIDNVTKKLRQTLGKNPDAEGFIHRLEEAAADASKNPNAESYMAFYRELNSMGKWMGRSERDRLITQVKDGIKESFKAEGKEGKILADKFEKANAGIKKAYQAEEVHDLIQKATTQDGLDYTKFRKLFDKADNVEVFKDVLGANQTKNLQTIAKTGSEIKDFDKAWKTTNLLDIGKKISSTAGASYYIYQGDWAGLAHVLAARGGSAAVKKLAEKSLTDPKFQNLMIRGLHAVKKTAPQSMKSVNNQMQKYLDEEGIDIQLD